MQARALFAAAAAVLVAHAPLFAQGQDTCANAQVITGLGTFAFDNTNATLDGTPDPLCLAFGNSDIQHDVWFSWVAPSSAYYQLDTCSQTSVDTKIGIYGGSCAGAVLACNDDTCGLQSQVTWNGNAGSTYLVRLGTFPGANGGTGTFTLSEKTPTMNPTNGHFYLVIRQAGITWTDADATAASILYQGVPGHLATLTDQQENDFVFALDNVNNCWVGGYQDLTDPNYSEPAGAWKWITGEPWSYTNWLAGEPNNMGAFGAEDYLELLESAGFGTTWNDVNPMEHPGGFVIEWDSGSATAYCFGDGSGNTCPCFNTGATGEGCANSTGAGAIASTAGSNSVAADDLTFAGSHLLPNKPALLFAGLNQVNSGNGVPFGDGLRCAGGNVRRLGVKMPNASGNASWGPGLAAHGGWTAGDTRRFQVWYRDPTGSPCGTNFNLSHGLELVFAP